MRFKIYSLLAFLTILTESCTVSFLPRVREQNIPTQSRLVALTGGLKITWKTDTITTGSYRIYTEETFNSLTNMRISLGQKGDIKPVTPGILEFIIDDLNPGNYVIEVRAYRRGINGQTGYLSSVQVTAGKQRAYYLGANETYFDSPPGRIDADVVLKKVIGIYDCATPTESIYLNQRFPDQIEKFDPLAERVFNFESSFGDMVEVFVDGKSVAKKRMESNSSGLADQLKIKAAAGAKIAIRTTPNDCVEFQLKDGYKYLFINRYPVRKWNVAYSNYGRAYY